jgi:hypothetical protein
MLGARVQHQLLPPGHLAPLQISCCEGRLQADKEDQGICLVQICGITSVADCEAAVKCGADLIGMIMWPKAKRAVSDATAAEISNTARKYGALPVGVFVDESAEIIVERCERAKLEFAQLHGDLARQSLHKLPLSLRVIYVMHATTSGEMVTELPSQQESAEGNIERVVRIEYLICARAGNCCTDPLCSASPHFLLNS